jgi:hypothetical protein
VQYERPTTSLKQPLRTMMKLEPNYIVIIIVVADVGFMVNVTVENSATVLVIAASREMNHNALAASDCLRLTMPFY